jgi:hypothetical protein
MATNAQTFEHRTAQSSSPFGGTLGVIALAFGIGVLGAYVFDLHSHTCVCGNRWYHLGAFNMGDEAAHQCRKCGTVQWWKTGFGMPFGLPQGAFVTMPPNTIGAMPQEFSEARQHALPSGTRR